MYLGFKNCSKGLEGLGTMLRDMGLVSRLMKVWVKKVVKVTKTLDLQRLRAL